MKYLLAILAVAIVVIVIRYFFFGTIAVALGK